MTLRGTHIRLWCALGLCVALCGCLRRDSLYPAVVPIPVVVIASDSSPVASPSASSSASAVDAVKADVATSNPAAKPTTAVASSSTEAVASAVSPPVEPPPASKARFVSRSYFVNREVRSDNIKMFPRWVDMLARYNAEAHTLDAICGTEQYSPCRLKEWKDFLENLRGSPLSKQLDEINRFLNAYPYIDDIVNWGFDNYWETPYEFQRKSGNCKDYAIAKFMSLRALGVTNDVMRIQVLRDLNLGGVIHAVLIVSVDGKDYILDNQIKQVVPTDKVYHYVPIYSINEHHWWQQFMLD